MQELLKLEGDIVNITFRSSETGFTVLELLSGDEYITAVGEMAEVAAGQKLVVFGSYVSHPSFGMQFKIQSYEVVFPSSVNAILTYLSSGIIKGIGPVTAKRIVDTFLEDTFLILDAHPEKLGEIKGLSYKKALEIQSEFKRIYGVQDAIREFSAFDISASEAINLYTQYGADVVVKIKENPYLICFAPCFLPFEKAEEIANTLTFEYDAKERIDGAVLYVLNHNTQKGHTCVPRKKLIKTVSAFISVEEDKIDSYINEMLDENKIILEEINSEEFIFIPELYSAEMIGAQKICDLLYRKVRAYENFEEKIKDIQFLHNIQYAPLQIKAIKTVLENNVCVITGGPGTGKTTLVKGIISLFESRADRVFLCAPTGRAAKRLSELSKKEAKTIHRLLGCEKSGRDGVKFSKNMESPLDCEVLIVDEFSMVDTLLFSHLITAVKENTRVILVGDYNQLPAVGAGNILKDLIQSNIVPKVELTEIFRQARESDIIVNAHSINNGEIPKTTKKQSDYYFISSNEMNAGNLISDLITQRLPKAYGFDTNEDIQILSPSRKKRGGTQNLNAILQEVINPENNSKHQIKINGITYRVGDKVMQTKNNYDIQYTKDDGENETGVFNGDIGYIISIDKFNRELKVRIEDKVYDYQGEDIQQLEHAWVITVHKSQGCEFKAVILSIPDTVKELQYRNLLYTAFTRAKELLIVVGKPEILSNMVKNNKTQLRYSAIKHFMTEYYYVD